MKEAALINDPEERAEKEKLIQEQYGALINDIVEQNELLKVNLYESTMSSLADLYNSNSINYENMTKGQQEILDTFLSSEYDMTNTAYNNLFGLYDKNLEQFRTMTAGQKEILVNQMLPQWNSTLQGMADKIVEKGGFIPTCKTAFEEITAATKTYEEALKQIETTGGKSFTDLKDGIDKTITSTQSLLTENEKLITSYKDQLAAVQAVIDKMQGLIDKYAAAKKAAEEYWLAAQKVWTDLKNKDADETQDAGLEDPDPPQTEPETSPEPQPEPEKPKEIKNGGFVTAGGAKIYTWPNSTGLAQYYANDPKYKVLDATTYPDWAQVRYHKLDSGVTGWFKKKDLTALRSGGYTGDWNSSDGRLALLHEKELVLNAQDTKNMLNAIKIVRTITDNLGAALLNKMGMISANTNNSILGSAAEALEQIVHIDAQFPNVTNSSEIEDALNNLVNRAAQHITKN